MKKILLTLSIALSIYSANAQVSLQRNNDVLMFKKSVDFNDAATIGSKYINESFEQAKVNNGSQTFLIRYNAYSDMMEYKNNKDVLELIKDKNTHFNFNNGDVYELFKYNIKGKEVERYQKVLVNGNGVKISKFSSVKLEPAKSPSNSYETYQQAAYKQNQPLYFITIGDVTNEFDGKAKSVEKLFPNKTAEIKQFFKNNKIKETDTDMIKLGTFLINL